jgi:hypothetical protein
MYPHQKTKISTLEEDFKSLGLDPDKSLDTIDRQHALVERRVGTMNDPNVSGGEPPVLDVPGVDGPSNLDEDVETDPDDVDAFLNSLTEDEDDVDTEDKPDAKTEEDDDQEGHGLSEEIMALLDEEYEPLLDISDIDSANKEEAFKAVRKKIRSASDKLRARLKRRKSRSKNRRRSKKYRAKNRMKIKRRMKRKLQKFGRAGLAKLHKMKKRVVMADREEDRSDYDALREDLLSLTESRDDVPSTGDYLGPFEEAAFSAGYLAMLIAEHFDAMNDVEAGDALFDLSESAADLCEDLEGIMDADDLSEENDAKLRSLVEGVIKGLRVYESIGAPGIQECFEYGEATLQEG